MRNRRIIPVLLLSGGLLAKGTRYADHAYLGDPRNALRIFNEKEVDELILLDIDATRNNSGPCLPVITEVVSSAFMPIACGGGVSSVETASDLIRCGAEKVVLNTWAFERPSLITACARELGAQSVVVAIDARKNENGSYEVWTRNASHNTGVNVVSWARDAAAAGCGEIMLGAVDREGTRAGYDLTITRMVTEAVDVPVIASGGAGTARDIGALFEQTTAAAAAAGTMFVFHGRRKAVLISYLESSEVAGLQAGSLGSNPISGSRP